MALSMITGDGNTRDLQSSNCLKWPCVTATNSHISLTFICLLPMSYMYPEEN